MTNLDEMNKNDVIDYFNNTFGKYDDWISKVVPKYHEMQKQIALAINTYFQYDSKIEVLEFGVGTGTTAKKILDTFPNAQFTGMDFSNNMIKVAQEKLNVFGSRSNLSISDFNSIELKANKYDIIISCLAIHHYEKDTISLLMKKIYTSLKEGGIFINADIVKFKSEKLSDNALKLYLAYLKEQLRDDYAIKVWEKHIELQDKPMPLTDLLDILKESEFKEVSSFWRNWGFAIYSGCKK